MDQPTSPHLNFEKSGDTVTQAEGPVNQDTQTNPGPGDPSSSPDQAACQQVTASTGSSSKRHLVRAASLVSGMTLTSRILGMIRDIVTAKSFGTSWQWDAFIYAFMLPNFFRRLVGEGALSNAFIPVYSEVLEKHGRQAAFRFANVMATVLFVVLLSFFLLLEAGLNVLLHFGTFSGRVQLTLDLLRFFFPYLFFISFFALAMGILNCHRHFLSPSLGPVILDLFWIAGVLWCVPFAGALAEDQLRMLALVILISGAVQVAVDIPPLYRIGFRPKWLFELWDQGLKRTVQLILPAILGFAVVQVNLLVDMTLGFFLGAGANSSLWYGTRLMQFPLGVFAIAMGTALLPQISQQATRKEFEVLKKTLSFALGSVFLIIIPCSIGLIVLAKPIVQLLFERGEFDVVSTARTAAVLLCYSIGLFAYSGQKIIIAGFYAVQDTRTPVKVGIAALVTNIVLNLILMVPLKEAGLALATSISGILQFFLLIYVYHRRIASFPFREITGSFVRIFLASIVMATLCVLSFRFLGYSFPGKGTGPLGIQVLGSISLSVLAYVAFCLIFRVPEMRQAVQWAFGKKKRTPISQP